MNVDGKSWNANLIIRLFNHTEAAAILQTPISLLGRNNKLIWQYSEHRNFTVASAYQWLAKRNLHNRQELEGSNNQEQKRAMWKRLWGMKVKGKIKHFMWRAFHQLLPVNTQLIRKGMSADPVCKSYGEALETCEHVFFQCKKSQLIWQLLPVRWDGLHDDMLHYQRWWQQVCLVGKQEIHQCRIELTACMLWGIWKMRNLWPFEASELSAVEVVDRAIQEWQEFRELTKRDSGYHPRQNQLESDRGRTHH